MLKIPILRATSQKYSSMQPTSLPCIMYPIIQYGPPKQKRLTAVMQRAPAILYRKSAMNIIIVIFEIIPTYCTFMVPL